MSLRAIGGKVIKHGTTLIRHLNKGKPTGRPPTRPISHSVGSAQQATPQIQRTDIVNNNKYHVFRNIGIQLTQRARRVLVDDVVNRVSNRFGTEVFQRVSQRGLYGNTGPLLTLVGVAVVSGQGILTKDDELEGVCWEIRECMSKIQWNRDATSHEETLAENIPTNLQSFTFGKPIAKGANAVVYSVKVASEQVQEVEEMRNGGDATGFPLALKMMFNYDIQSNSLAILKAMYRETVPAPVYFNQDGISDIEYDFLNMTRHLPPHPNIVKILSVFTDFIPELERCREMYPAALPKRIDPDGEGRNMSLFILMKRYHQSLQEYLRSSEKPSVRTSALLLTQLLEGVVHMVAHNVAHRDLKTDNVLLDLSDPKSPMAVISDFGCCLAEKSTDLSLSYTSHGIEKGGNTALMAPEILGKKPGSFSRLNYSKSDLWAVGAIGYEIFGMPNPFYGNKSSRLCSMSYKDEDLPSFPETVPSIFNRLIKNLLRRDPNERLDPDVAANVCQLFLWAPSPWLDGTKKFPTYEEILEWLLNIAAKILCEGGRSRDFYHHVNKEKLTYSEYLMISTFLCRVKLANIKLALTWIRNDIF